MHHILSPSAILDWIGAWGYLGVFVCVFVGNLGVPVPEETVLLTAGFLAGRGILDLRYLYFVGVGSAVTGDCCGFLFGRTGGRQLMERLTSHFESLRVRYERLRMFFETHGAKAVFMARFIAGARFMAGPMAGACGMSFWRFFGWNVLGAIIWCSLMVTVGYLVGDELSWVIAMAHTAGRWVAAAALVVIATIWLFWWRERHAQNSRA